MLSTDTEDVARDETRGMETLNDIIQGGGSAGATIGGGSAN